MLLRGLFGKGRQDETETAGRSQEMEVLHSGAVQWGLSLPLGSSAMQSLLTWWVCDSLL